jgi:hypothetical protein
MKTPFSQLNLCSVELRRVEHHVAESSYRRNLIIIVTFSAHTYSKRSAISSHDVVQKYDKFKMLSFNQAFNQRSVVEPHHFDGATAPSPTHRYNISLDPR